MRLCHELQIKLGKAQENEEVPKVVSWGEAREYGFQFFYDLFMKKFSKRIYEPKMFGFYFYENLRICFLIS